LNQPPALVNSAQPATESIASDLIGGFNVHVGGKTDLVGGQITSSDKAVTDHKNQFTSAGPVTTTDLQNKSALDASSVSVNVSVNGGGASTGSTGGMAGYGSVNDSQTSTTRAGISGVAGNTAARTGDAQTGLKPVFTQQDADKINKSLSVQTSVTATFGQNASKAIGDLGASKTAPIDKAKDYQALKDKESAGSLSPAEQTRLASMEQNGYTPDRAQAALNNPQNQADYANWKEGGPARVAAHTIVGGLTGGTNGVLGAATSQTVVPLLGEQLASLDIPADLKKGIILAAGLSIGVATGGVGDAVTATNATVNNYLKYTELVSKKAERDACNGDASCPSKIDKKYDQISQERNAKMSASCADGDSAQCHANLSEMTSDLQQLQAAGGDKSKGYTGMTPEERNNIKQVMSNTSTNLEVLALRGNQQLGTAYRSPDELVKAGILTPQEGAQLQASRANDMVGFLGAIALPGGAKANPAARSGAGKSAAEEFTVAPSKSSNASSSSNNVNVNFETQGLKNVDVMRIPDGVKMVRELEKSGLSQEEAIAKTKDFIASGSTPPVARPVDITDNLVKVVPAGSAPSTGTGYWMTQSEFNALKADPASMVSKLGLPPYMHADAFDVFQITPRPGALVFESTIAPTTVNGVASTTGGARQTIVVDRNQFTPPVKIGSVKVN
jgi:hypothetical protein